MSKDLNATCAICGKKYHVCNTCRETKTIKPWRSITDTIDCYKIYMIIYQYDRKEIGKEEAMEMLNSLTIPDTLQDHIKKVIEEIKNGDDVDQTNIKKVTSKKGASSTAKVKNNE